MLTPPFDIELLQLSGFENKDLLKRYCIAIPLALAYNTGMQNKPFIDVLRKHLKSRGITYKELAQQLHLSESSVKRLFSEGSFTLERYLEICKIIEIPPSEVAKAAESDTPEKFHEYTVEQEEFFAKNLKHLAFFDQLLKLGSAKKVAQAHSLSKHQTALYLSKLDKLGLIKWLPGDKVKFLTPKEVVWRKKGALRKVLLESAKKEFLISEFSGENDFFKFSILDLSEENRRRFRVKLEDLVRDLNQVSSFDRSASSKSIKLGMMIAMRPWNFSVLERVKDY